jgi:hypothetical protein
MFRDFSTRMVALSAVAALAVAALGATPASAATKPKAPSYVAAANGIVGVQQTIRITAPRYAGRTVGVSIAGPGSTTPVNVTLDGQGLGSTTWTPSSTGTWTVQGTGPFAAATGSSIFVSAVPTVTTLFAPTQVQASTASPNENNVASTLVASVSVPSGTLTPAGSVRFSYLNGATIGSAPLVASGSGSATATLGWTTPEIGYYTVVATYFPVLGAGGFTNTGASSDTMQIQTVQAAPSMSLRVPSKFRLGSPTSVTAVVTNAALTGSVAFDTDVNGTSTSISPSVSVSGGSATVPWSPVTLGNQIISASFSATNSNASASASQIISVMPALTRDPISAGPSGQGQWPIGPSIALPTGARVAIATATQSGSPVSIASTGGCVIIGSTLIAPSAAGSCSVSVSSPGSSAWAPNSATYNFTVAPPAKG